ncbi:MAG: beta-propeller fold lactonase family protein [Nannocystaceae bacterium]|nr:beta-propeller fold lactonase family protein [Nannocystaceae bacterium]
MVSLPFDGLEQSKRYTVLQLAQDGTLSPPGAVFEMGRAFDGPIRLTPDGRFGVAAQVRVGFEEDNSLGVFEVDARGSVTVVEAMFDSSFFPHSFTMSADGETLWVLDQAFPEAGGGIYEVSLGCDGTLSEVGLAVAGRLISTLDFTSDGRVLVGAHRFDGAPAEAEAFVFDWRNPAAPLGAADLFGHEDAVIQAAVVTPDDAMFVLADTSTFAPAPNRVGFGRVEDGTIIAEGTIDIFNPYEMVASPFGDVLLVASGEQNAIYILDYDPLADPAITLRGELEYVGAPPQLPGKATRVQRGTLEGLVIWAENTGIRRIQFGGDGVVTDLGLHDIGEITGAIGVQP